MSYFRLAMNRNLQTMKRREDGYSVGLIAILEVSSSQLSILVITPGIQIIIVVITDCMIVT